MAIRTVGSSLGASSRSSPVSGSTSSRVRGQSSSTPNAKQATGTATRARPSTAPVPSASPDPTGPARSVHSPSAKIAPATNSTTARTSPRCPANCRPAASRPRARTPGSTGAAFARAVVVFRAEGFRAVFFLDRDDARRRRVLVAGIPER